MVRRHVVAAVGGLALFALLAATVPRAAALPFDREILDALHAARSESLTRAMRVVTRLGDVWLVILLTALSAGLLWRPSRRASLFMAASVVGTGLLNLAIKRLLERVRPVEPPPVYEGHGYAFPSGHAMLTAALAFAWMLVASRLWPRARGYAVAAGMVLAVAVGVSRVYLGVHYPSDVLGGWALSLAWVALAGLWLPRRTSPRDGDRVDRVGWRR